MKFELAVVVALLSAACVWKDVEGLNCTVNSLLGPSNPSLMLDKVEGHWLVLMRAGVLANTNYSDTLDIIPTVKGLTTYSSGFLKSDQSQCEYSALEMINSTQPRVFTTNPSSNQPQTLIFAAYHPNLHVALLYLCDGHVSESAICQQPTAILAGKPDTNATAAMIWLNNLDKYVACILPSNPKDVIYQNASRVCPLKTIWGLPGRNCNVDSFPVVDNFNLSRYMGVWQEVSWLVPDYVLPRHVFTEYYHSYTLLKDGSINVTQEFRKPSNNKCYFRNSLLTKTNVTGKLTYHEGSERKLPYNVILVDYDRYALVYGCYNVSNSTRGCLDDRGWLWSRADVTVTWETHLKVNSKLQDLCVNPSAMLATPHNNRCKWPEPTSGAFSPAKETNRAAAILIACLTFLLSF